MNIENYRKNDIEESFYAEKSDDEVKSIDVIQNFFEHEDKQVGERNEIMKSMRIEVKQNIMTIDIETIFTHEFKSYGKVIDSLLNSGVSVNAIDERLHETMLMFASRTNNLSVVQYLIKKNADIEIKNVYIN